MPLSRYMKTWHDPARPGYAFLYSTKKGSLVRIPEAQLTAARDGTLGEELRVELRRMEIWVDDPAAERAAMAGLVDATNARGSRFKATVVLTLDCNLACPYCYEDRFRGRFAMNDAIARQLVAFVLREQIGCGRDVELRFYGGEPLMAVPRLKEIAGPLQEVAASAGTRFSCSMVTNGTLLTRSLVEELLPLGLTSAQVTLDGPPEIHDCQRPFVSGKGSFKRIVDNLAAVYDLISLKLGGNFTRENYREFPAMLDLLLAAGLDPARLAPIMFAPILPKSGQRAGHDAACVASSEPWLIEATLFPREETIKRGFSVMKPTMGVCMIELANDIVVNYDGSLYKCPAFMGWPELAVGTLADGIGDYRDSHNLNLWRNDDCLDCAYLPLCFGGCRLIPLLKNGIIDEVDCRKAFYDAALEQMVLQGQQHSSRKK